jgi:hypothetical protein
MLCSPSLFKPWSTWSASEEVSSLGLFAFRFFAAIGTRGAERLDAREEEGG